MFMQHVFFDLVMIQEALKKEHTCCKTSININNSKQTHKQKTKHAHIALEYHT